MPRRKPPVSDIQLAANRANAAKSTGPRTPQGKARSAQNARKHSFTASTFAVVRLEDLHEVAHLRADLLTVYQPVNSQELFAIERMALAQQAILRAARLETGLFTTCLNEALDTDGNPTILMNAELAGDGDIEITRAQNRNYLLGEGFHRMVRQSNSWSLLIRYQGQAERHYRRAVEEFNRLKALRQELPNEPVFDPQPEPNEPLPPHENEPISAGNPVVGTEGGGPPAGCLPRHHSGRRPNAPLRKRRFRRFATGAPLACPAPESNGISRAGRRHQPHFAEARLLRRLQHNRRFNPVADSQMLGDTPRNTLFKLMKHKNPSTAAAPAPHAADPPLPATPYLDRAGHKSGLATARAGA